MEGKLTKGRLKFMNNQFTQVPYRLFKEPYSNMRGDSKLLYSLLLSRYSLSEKNNMKDKCGETFVYLGIKDMTLYNVIKTIENCYQEFCEDERFTSMLYNYLFNNHKELGPYRERLKSMCIIPVKPMKYEGIDFVCFSNKIFINDSMRFSPNSCDLLDTKRMSKEQYEAIFGTNLNELNEQMEETLYRKNLSKLLNERLSTTDEDLYEKLMGEFINNRKLLSQCIDTLKMHIKQIPLKNECGEIKRGHIYVSDEPTGYFEGNVLPRHIAHMECQAFAKFLGCKNIRNVYFEDLDITEVLTDNDIEAFQDESIVNGFEILERCKRKGLVATELVDVSSPARCL